MSSPPNSRIFLAGAAGIIGRRLVPLLLREGYAVTGTTRSRERAEELDKLGVEPAIVDMFDADAVIRAVVQARPDVLIHQLTDLPKIFSPAAMDVARARNARLREETAPTLMRAAQQAGTRRVIVQSICFAYFPGRQPHLETDVVVPPSVRAMESAALNTPGVEAVVLRYGRLWGPGTWNEGPKDSSPLHVDAAAHAALLAITKGSPGAYNIAEDDGTVSTDKARRELGFDPAFRICGITDGSPPRLG